MTSKIVESKLRLHSLLPSRFCTVRTTEVSQGVPSFRLKPVPTTFALADFSNVPTQYPELVISVPPIHVAMAIVLVWFSAGLVSTLHAQEQQSDFDLQKVVERLDRGRSKMRPVAPWWNDYVGVRQRKSAESVDVDITGLLVLAIYHSNQIQIASTEPKIRKAFVKEMDAGFDWTHYVDGNWNDTSEPTGSSLTAGDGITQFNDHQFSAESGIRRQTRKGGQFSLGQRFGWQDNNSNFLTPPNQANSRLTLSYTHPLLRGRGEAYNTSVVVLAKIDALIADEEFRASLEDHLLEIVRAYWSLFLERTVLAQQARLFLKTEEIVKTLKARMQFDAERTQYISALAAMESRKANLLQTQLNVVNSESRLRSLINAQELGQGNEVELIPVDVPSVLTLKIELQEELNKAIENRTEAHVATQRVRQAMTRLGVAQHEILPQLNLITQGYLSGLQGDADFGSSFRDQFSAGSPSYTMGINYEYPIGNRAASSRQTQRQLELSRIEREYQQTVQSLQMEVESAVRRLYTARREINVRSQALQATEAEVVTLRRRWDGVLGRGQNAGLNLEALLRAQERVADFEQQYVTALINYNLTAVELRRVNGTLLKSEPLFRAEESVVGNQPPTEKAVDQSSGRPNGPAAQPVIEAPPSPLAFDQVAPPYVASNVTATEVSAAQSSERFAIPRFKAATRKPSPPSRESRYAALPENFRVQTYEPARGSLSFPSYGRPAKVEQAKPFPLIPERPLSTANFSRPKYR